MEEWKRLSVRLRSSADVGAYAKESDKYSYETLSYIHQQLYARQMAKSYFLLGKHGQRLVDQFKAGESLLDIAEWINLSPTMVARRILELYCKWNRKQITEALRDPSRITDERLREDVRICIDCDEYSGPHVDRIRNVVGLEYELRLIDELRNLRLEFETEQDLRNRGCHKTPDILLRIPVAFRGKTVCWVDSKAKFGDQFTLNKDYSNSVSSYVGRFGPGMVIYWFGLIEDCPSPMMQDSGLLIVDSFPADVQMLAGTTIPIPFQEHGEETVARFTEDCGEED